MRHKSKPLKCARHVHAKHRAVCAASAVTHPNDCISNAAASEQSCSSAQQPRCMRAFEIAFSLHIGTQRQAVKMCATCARGHRYHLCDSSNSTIAQMLPAPHRVTQPRASEAAALPGNHRCMRASAIGSGLPICAQRQAAKMRAACARVKQKCTRRFASARQVTGVALSSSYPGWTGPCQQPVLLILDWAEGSDRYVVVHARPPVPLAAPIAFASKSSHAE